MTREFLENIYLALYHFYKFLYDFWEEYEDWFFWLPIVEDVIEELQWLLWYVYFYFYDIFHWWDYIREEPNIFYDFWHFLYYLDLGLLVYVTDREDVEGVPKLVYWPAKVADYLLLVARRVFQGLDAWYNIIKDAIDEILNWETLKELIIGWLPGLEDAITFFENLVDEFLTFAADPIEWLKEKWKVNVWNYLKTEVEPFKTVNLWYENNKDELALFFADPWGYLKTKVYPVVWEYLRDNIPVITTIYIIYQNLKEEIDLFVENPTLWWQGKVTDTILPWLKENVPLFSTLYKWYETYKPTLELFFDDPIKWLDENTILGELKEFWADPLQWTYDKLDEWFERFW